ncbi:nucleotide pyrophosphatase/phosphodiesterase family protein [Subtercola sp. RTI3]|uniref:alkaline phosphatase family protein n=1 Tax=Subtercola sp. RTI3 TaxID=3048639 RepID=UPI002B2355D3|nr:nucleotide pyrophosphatase/phosphodiesterase family protein [Subtercola sp. RTI3]MEA9984816.1 alkaline phosphatase family protein [Subtercola sp. RTI3]
MPPTIPALDPTAPHLTDVLPSCIAALGGAANRLELRPVDRAVVVLVDGLGAAALRANSGHARHLAARLTKRARIASGFPTTTAAALASLTTGVSPGTHGLVGYTAYVPSADAVKNQLTGWGPAMQPDTWQAQPTLFEQASAAGIGCSAIGAPRYTSSGFTHAVLRGAHYVAGKSIADRFAAARAVLDSAAATSSKALVYVYIPELDMAAHASGWQSDKFTAALETVDAETEAFALKLRQGEGMLLTADHGMLDIPATSHVLFDENPALVRGVAHVAGDPRCLQLHVAGGSGPKEAERQAMIAELLAAWREAEGERAWVLSGDEAVEAGWFGAVLPGIRSRIGDVIVAARKNIAYYDSRTTPAAKRTMIGQHGSWSDDELYVPLLGFGAFERP